MRDRKYAYEFLFTGQGRRRDSGLNWGLVVVAGCKQEYLVRDEGCEDNRAWFLAGWVRHDPNKQMNQTGVKLKTGKVEVRS